jgi:hypothetical protein
MVLKYIFLKKQIWVMANDPIFKDKIFLIPPLLLKRQTFCQLVSTVACRKHSFTHKIIKGGWCKADLF